MERITNRKTTAATDVSASGGGSVVLSSATAPGALVTNINSSNKMSNSIMGSPNLNTKILGEKKNNNASVSRGGGGEVVHHHNSNHDDDSNLKNDLNTRPRPARALTHTITTSSNYYGMNLLSRFQWLCSMRTLVLLILCLQNSLFTVLRRFSQGVLHEKYSKYEALLLAEIIKMIVSARMIQGELRSSSANNINNNKDSQSTKGGGGGEEEDVSTLSPQQSQQSSSSFWGRLIYLIGSSRKMVVLASIYGTMNILSFFSLLNIGAGMFTIFAQCKILTTAAFSTIILKRQYSWTKWRALISLMLGVVLFSEPIWGNISSSSSSASGSSSSSSGSSGGEEAGDNGGRNGDITTRFLQQLAHNANPKARPLLGMCTQAIEVTLSGFAAIYFEKVIKVDPLHHTIWERNFQLALASIPVHVVFILYYGGGSVGFGGGWSWTAVCVSLLGAAGGLLVALSIKYGDAILKTLATTGSIIISSVLDHFLLGGPLSPLMSIAAGQVIISICDYTFDASPPLPDIAPGSGAENDKTKQLQHVKKQETRTTKASTTLSSKNRGNQEQEEEFSALLPNVSGLSADSVGSTTAREPSVSVV